MTLEKSSRGAGKVAAPDSQANPEIPDEAVVPADAATEPRGKGLNSLQVVGSVFAAGLGVQSSKNRERDFKQGRAGTFIAAGLVFTLLFIGTVYTVVTMVLSNR